MVLVRYGKASRKLSGIYQVAALPTISGLEGVTAAAITPRGKTGDVNFGATFELIDYLCAARVDGIALFTAWGEYPALAVDDRARLTYLAVKRSRVPVVAGVGSATLGHSLQLAREARSAGVAAILLPPPLYHRYDHLRVLYAVRGTGGFRTGDLSGRRNRRGNGVQAARIRLLRGDCGWQRRARFAPSPRWGRERPGHSAG